MGIAVARLRIVFLQFIIAQLLNPAQSSAQHFVIEEASIAAVHRAFAQDELTSRQLVEYYLDRIETLNPRLRAVVEVNPDALDQADIADDERRRLKEGKALRNSSFLHGIPVLLKDSIATKDKLNTSAGSCALVGAVPPRDAHVVARLRRAGAVILGKASMSEWYGIRSLAAVPAGWCARSGVGINPYLKGGSPCGSSSGSAISVAANMAMVSLGSETQGSLICPGSHNSVVSIKPTVGLVSRAGVIPITHRQDTVGPMARTVADAVHLLDHIVGYDEMDHEATSQAAAFIPADGYTKFLDENGLKGKRLGVVRNPFLELLNISTSATALDSHLQIMREKEAIIIDDLEISNIDVVLDPFQSGQVEAVLAEFKLNLNNYLKELTSSPVRSLSDIIIFNQNHPVLEMTREYGQELFIRSNLTNGIDDAVQQAIENLNTLSEQGFEKLMSDYGLDAVVSLGYKISYALSCKGFPAITVPAGYSSDGMPFGIFFGGLKGSEPTLIQIAYAFEQATQIRKPPTLFPGNERPKSDIW